MTEHPRKEPNDKGVVTMTADSKEKGSACQGCEEASEEELLARLDDVLERYKGSPEV